MASSGLRWAKPLLFVIAQLGCGGYLSHALAITPSEVAVDAPDQGAGGEVPAWDISPRVALRGTVTSNVAQDENPRRDYVGELAPGIRLHGRGARVKLYLDYELRGVIHAQDSPVDEWPRYNHQSLRAAGTIEAIERWFFVDVSGNISQQTVSAFGSQGASTSNLGSNTTEASNYRISPYVRGRVLGETDYEVRYSDSLATTESSVRGDVRTSEAMVTLKDGSPRPMFWAVDATTRRDSYRGASDQELRRAKAQIGYVFAPELRASVNAGGEENDYLSSGMKSYPTRGYGISYLPGPRTDISYSHEKRFFGGANTVAVSHRTARAIFRYSQGRDVTSLPGQLTSITVGNIYDLLYAQRASAQPDPELRAAEVRTYLETNGVAPDTPVTAGFLTTQVFVQRHHDLSLLLTGTRTSLTLAYRQTDSEKAGAVAGVADDFLSSSRIRQRGGVGSVSHRLTPLTNANLMLSRQHTIGDTGAQESTLKTIELGLQARFSRTATGDLRLTKKLFDSAVSPYEESATTASITMAF